MSNSESNETSGEPSRQWFTTTHWSVVLSAADSSAPGAAEALEKLCRTYWYPLYVYVRRQGYNEEDAQDLTQAFFARFLEKKSVSLADPERGKFRSFLLTSLKHFLAHEWERARAAKRGGGQAHVSWDQSSADTKYQLEPVSNVTPEANYDQQWAFTLFQKALARLAEEYATAGKGNLFDQLKIFLTEAAKDNYDGLAPQLGLTKGALTVAVYRLRYRYAELVRDEIAQTVGRLSEVQAELRYLVGLVSVRL